VGRRVIGTKVNHRVKSISLGTTAHKLASRPPVGIHCRKWKFIQGCSSPIVHPSRVCIDRHIRGEALLTAQFQYSEYSMHDPSQGYRSIGPS
jgi:hypothetical protein